MKESFEVALLIGSDSDLPLLKPGIDILKEFGVSFKVQVLSAHRSPEAVRDFVLSAKEKGIRIFICAAGGAAHLAGTVAAHSTLPVIGIPVPTQEFGGMDSLLSTVQMPGGVPVATVAVGKSGSINAALLAVQILALGNEKLAAKLDAYKKKLASAVEEKNARLESTLK